MTDDRPGAHRRLAELTTLRLGGPAATSTEAASGEAIVDAVRAADARGERVLLVGGGSNLVVSDAGWPGLVVLLRSRGVDVARSKDRARLTVAAGEPWDDLVAHTVAEGWSGLECLAGIPGLVGATPVQNVGAYGADVAQTLRSVRVFDRDRRLEVDLDAAQCGFAYRTSIFKNSQRYVVLSVTFDLGTYGHSAPIAYAELARALGVAVGERAPLPEVRAAVLSLRRGKGMVLDPADHDTWSAGSFFTNPIVEPAVVDAIRVSAGDGVPHWPDQDGLVKLSAAWLIQHAGFGKGYGTSGHGTGPVTLSTKHTLALTNRGAASTADLLGLAREIRAGVRERWGVTLTPEPLLIDCEL